MKYIARFLVLVVICGLCIAMTGCTDLFEPKWRSINSEFMVTIDEVEQQEIIDFEIARSYYITFNLFGDVVDDVTYKEIKFEYNEENALVTFAYDYPKSKEIRFKIYLYELGNDDTLKITYNGKSVEVGYNVLDYDFEGANWITPSSINDLDPYAEFKEMLLSIKYYEFEAPYPGLHNYSYSSYSDEGYWYYDLKDKKDVGYLEYLIDSIYYPSVFDLVEKNPIASRDAYMSFKGREKVMEGAGRSAMETFCVSFSIIDPCCTNPQYPLKDMSFYARNLNLHKYTIDRNPSEYPLPITILMEKYPERFFEYDLNGLKIYIVITGDKNKGIRAYFSDETYFYTLSATYEYD